MAMLGAKCSPCCKDTCPCVEGELPATVTVSLSGPMGTKEQGGHLLPLSFSSCFGSGAEGHAVAPGGTPGEDNGPISSAALTKQGSGYAVLGREAPSLSLGNDNSTPADVTITLHEYTDSCGRPLWRVESISVTDGGEGYTDGDALVITAAEGTTIVAEAKGTITTVRTAPTIEVTTEDGTGAEFTVAVEQTKAEPSTWTITGVTFTGTTSGYVDGQEVTFGGDDVVEVAPAEAYVRTVRVAPTVEVIEDSVGGTGAVLTATLIANGTTPETWKVSSVSVDDPGTGYGFFNTFRVVATDGVAAAEALVIVLGTGEDGEITEVGFESGNFGEYYKPTDVLDFIELTEGGEYYEDIGEIESVEITDGGVYYAEDASLPAIVADVEVKVEQLWPSAGSGAELSAVVDDTPGSATFGQITSVTVDDGGENYLGWRWIYACDCEWGGDNGSGNGLYDNTVVAWKSSECSYTGYRCWPDGPTEEPVFGLLRVRLVSDVKSMSIPIAAPGGMPGRDGGPVSIEGILELSDSFGLQSGWAYVDEEIDEVVAPEITVTVEQSAPSTGSGAEITATIDTDKDSETFGQVTLALVSGGDGYLGDATGWNGVTVEYRGPSLPPLVTDYASNCAPCSTTLTSNTLINDCSNFSFTATFGEATAEVSPGGSITPVFEGPNKCCGRCYNKCPDRPSQLTVTFTREAADDFSWRSADQVGDLGRPFLDHDGQDAFRLNCEAHEVEVVFDFEDLEEQLNCGPFEACVIGSLEEGGGWQLDPGAPTLVACPDGAEHVIESLSPSLDGPRIALNDGTFVRQHRTEMTRAVFSLNSFALRCDQPQIAFTTTSQWIGYYRSAVGSTENDSLFGPTEIGGVITNVPAHQKTGSHILRNGKKCGDHPGDWIVSDVEEGGPQQNGTFGTAQMFGRLSGNFLELRSGVYRRICHHYEIDVEFS